MSGLARLWRWWTDTWRTPGRARWLYIVMALGFSGLALIATLNGDSAFAALAGLIAVVTVVLAVAAPWLSRWMNPPGGPK